MVARGGAQAQPLETTVIKYLSGALEGRKNLSPFQGSELALSLSRGCAALRPWLPSVAAPRLHRLPRSNDKESSYQSSLNSATGS